MKKYLIIASAAVLALVGCSKEQEFKNPDPKTEETVLTFTSKKPVLVDAETKTAWNPATSSIVWTEGDQIRVGYKLDGAWMGKSAAGAPKFYLSKGVSIDSEDAGIGTFNVPVDADTFTDPGTTGSYVFYGITPKVSGTDIVSSESVATLTLPASQVPEANSYDKSADFMIGKSEATSLSGLPEEAIELSWNRIVAQADITFSNLDFDGTEAVSSIKLTFDDEAFVAGNFTVNVETGAVSGGSESEITLEGANLVAGANSVEAWCCLLPVTFTALDVEIKTDKATYTRSISSISKTFKKNARNTLTVNMSTASRKEEVAPAYELYTGTLTEGDYIIYDATDGHALKATVSSNRFGYAEVTPVNGVISTKDASILWHIAPSATDGYFTIYNSEAGKYAAATNSNNQGQLLVDGTDDKSLWSVDGSYDFINKARSSVDNKYLRSNGAYGFACYASSTGHTLQLYKVDTREPLAAPASVSAELDGTVSNTIKVTFSTVSGAETYVITATPTNGGDAEVKDGVTASPAAIEGLAYNTEYAITVYAVPATSDAAHKKSAETAASSYVTTGAKPAGPEGYELITSIDDVTTGLYIIAAKVGDKYIGLPNTLGTSPFAGTELTVDDDVVTTANASGFSLTITENDGKYSIAGASSTLGYGSSTSFSTNTSGNAALWTISKVNTHGSFRIANVGTNTRAIVYRTGTTNKFGAYSTSNVTSSGEYYDVELFKFNGVVKTTPTTTVTPASPIELTVGDTQQLNVTTDSDGAKSYVSSDTDVATVTTAGLIEAVAAGTATITVTTAATENFNAGSTEVTVTVTNGPSTIADALAAPGTYEIKNVLVYAKTTSALILGDATGKIYAYKSGHGLSVGEIKNVSGATKWYNGVYEYDSPTLNGSGTGDVDHGTAVEFDNEYSSLATTFAPGSGSDPGASAVYVHAIGSQSGRKITTAKSELYLAAADNTNDGNNVEVYGYVYAYNTSNSNFNFVAVSIEEYVDPNAPKLSVSPATTAASPASWAADNDDAKTFTVTATNGTWEITDDSTVSGWANISVSDDVITVTPKEKQASAANSGTITIKLTPSNSSGYSALTETIYLAQAKYGDNTWTLVSTLNNLVAGTYTIAALYNNKYYTVPNTTISGQTFNCTEATYSESDGLTPPSGSGEFVFTAVTGVDNAFYIYNTSLKKYLVATGSKKFGYVDASSSDYGYWTFSVVASGGFSGVFSVKHSSKTHYMRAYDNSVRCYDGTSNNGVYLFINN